MSNYTQERYCCKTVESIEQIECPHYREWKKNIEIKKQEARENNREYYKDAVEILEEMSLAEQNVRVINSQEIIENAAVVQTLPEKIMQMTESKYAGKVWFSSDFEIVDGVLKKYKGNLLDVVVPEGVYKIEAAFEGMKNLQSIKLPSSLREISHRAFAGCKSLKEIDIPIEVQYIGAYAFKECSSLKAITIHQGIVDYYAFNNCTSLRCVEIKSLSAEIHKTAFFGCSSLYDMKLPRTINVEKFEGIGEYLKKIHEEREREARQEKWERERKEREERERQEKINKWKNSDLADALIAYGTVALALGTFSCSIDGGSMTESFLTDPIESTSAFGMLTSTFMSVVAGGNSSGGGNVKGIFIPLDDNVPYTHIEKRATQIHNALNMNSKNKKEETFFVTKSKESYDAVMELFGKKEFKTAMDLLDILEEALSDEKGAH